ncbi:Protein FAM22 [Fukomys damarensis]|uniref:Protein FAM22 n=1 Tax=Fukomys damarensis TaxID=885580 RepID=A0A091CST6_FUKDA|nr:Protein FAM22 [Fukomys damarensis]
MRTSCLSQMGKGLVGDRHGPWAFVLQHNISGLYWDLGKHWATTIVDIPRLGLLLGSAYAFPYLMFMETEDPKLQLMEGLLGQPLPASQRPDSPRTTSPEVVHQPVYVTRNRDTEARPACVPAPKHQKPPETQLPDEIPPEAVREYMETMDWLEKCPPLALGKPRRNQKEDRLEQQQGEDRMYPDLLSYCDELCSQEDFVTKTKEMLQPGGMLINAQPSARGNHPREQTNKGSGPMDSHRYISAVASADPEPESVFPANSQVPLLPVNAWVNSHRPLVAGVPCGFQISWQESKPAYLQVNPPTNSALGQAQGQSDSALKLKSRILET